jgi:hypothetical protein
MKNRKDILIIVGLFAALILFIAFGPARRPQPASVPEATSHSSAPEGTLALYTWVRGQGYDGRRLEYREFALDEADSALLILNPSEPINRSRARAVLDWVGAGGTLIMALDRNALFGPQNELLADLQFDTAVYSGTGTLAQAGPAQPVLDQPPVTSAPVQATRVLVPRRADFVALLGAPDALVLAGIKIGSGYAYLSASAFPFSNEGLRDPQNAALVLNMLRRVPAGGRIQFDEYHHGFFTPPSTGRIVFGSPWGWAAAYAVLVIGLYLLLSGRRFGRPIPLQEELVRRSSTEYVESMADLFLRGGKRAYILKHYRAAFKRRLAQRDGINPQLDDAEFVRELARARELDEPALAALLARLRAASPSDAELVRTVADADALADTIGLPR